MSDPVIHREEVSRRMTDMHCPTCEAPKVDRSNTCSICGEAAGQNTLPVGTVLYSRYYLDGLLGQGGFGITYAATHVKIGSRVAIKELFPDGASRLETLIQPPGSLDAQGWEETKRRFMEEGQVLARFSHPDIVRVLDFFEERGTSYIVMELLAGESLQERLNRVKKLTTVEVEEAAVRLMKALIVVHEAGLLHRDIKPGNIFLEASGRIVLIDFGSAREFVSGRTTSNTRLVSPGYAPLEQYGSAARFGPYSDIYALGATLFHALTGSLPPSATDLAQGHVLPALPSDTPQHLRAVIEQSMALRVDQRPQTVRELLGLLSNTDLAPLEAIAKSSTALRNPIPKTGSASLRQFRRPLPWLWLISVLALALGLLTFRTVRSGTAIIDTTSQTSGPVADSSDIDIQSEDTEILTLRKTIEAQKNARQQAITTHSRKVYVALLGLLVNNENMSTTSIVATVGSDCVIPFVPYGSFTRGWGAAPFGVSACNIAVNGDDFTVTVTSDANTGNVTAINGKLHNW